MRFQTPSRLVLPLLLVAAFLLAGCEASVSTGSQKETLENAITEQLPGKVAGQVKDPKVDDVSCVEGETGKFDCIAKLTFTDDGKSRTEDVGISGKCDAKDCVWETKS